ncbi:hypothetical protein [Metabacillus sp. B2-18]|uniref:hypothetical protein n=1 Tax=Metabacillus sp. B2-18 TaxID=2897333 RepID=UPI001E3A856C|nr:hypothetical protein [Metabacillus sp. B2-18]UGB31695.1 hypothetical protein LPC09_04225 [Metabacillus sp. B2-18]
MKLADHLDDEQKNKLNQLKKPKPSKKKQSPKKKKIEERVDWVDIMGMNRDTYKRNRGAIRRK